MKTLKDWWSFANDATKLSDAEQVAKGEANWSPLAEQALRESACMIIDRVGPENVPTFCDPKTWALEHHPQAFEELSLAIGAALEKMRSAVPEARLAETATWSRSRVDMPCVNPARESFFRSATINDDDGEPNQRRHRASPDRSAGRTPTTRSAGAVARSR